MGLLTKIYRRLVDLADYAAFKWSLLSGGAVNVLQLAQNAGVLTGTGTPTDPWLGWDQVPIASDRHYYFPAGHYSKIGEWKINATNEILQRATISGDPAGTFLHITATNAVQKLHLQNYVNGGTYPLWYGGAFTTVAWNASAATLQTALRTLTGINTLTVGTWAFADASAIGQPGNPYKITFPAGGPYPIFTGDPTGLTTDLTKASGSHPYQQPTVVCFAEAAVSLGPITNASASDANNSIVLENLVIDCTGTCGVGIYLGKWFYGRVRNVQAVNFSPAGVTYGVVLHDNCTAVWLDTLNFGAWGKSGLVGTDGNVLPLLQPGNGQVPQYAICPSIALYVGGGPYYNGNTFVKTLRGQYLGMFHHTPDTSDATKICLGSTTGADSQVVISGFTVSSAVKSVLLTSGTTKTVRGFYPVTSITGQTLTLAKNPRSAGGETNIRVVINPTPLPMTGIGALIDGSNNGFCAEGTSFNISERYGVYTNANTRDCLLDRIDSEEVANPNENYTSPIITGSPAISVAATKFHRSAGSFVNDGFRVGQSVYARGWANAANNGVFPISVVTASDLTVTGTTLVNEAAGNGVLSLDVLDLTTLFINGQNHQVVNSDSAPRARIEGKGHRFFGGTNWLNSGTAYLHIDNSDDSEFHGPAAFDASSKGARRRIHNNPAVFGLDRMSTARLQFVGDTTDAVTGNLDGNPSGNDIFPIYCTDTAGNLIHAAGIGAGSGRDTVVVFGIPNHNVYVRPAAPDTVGSASTGAIIYQPAGGHFQLQDEFGNLFFQNGYDAHSWFDHIKLKTLGKKFFIAEGTNAAMGVATLNGTTNVTVSTTAVTANSRIFLTGQSGAIANSGSVRVTGRTAGTSFTVASTNAADVGTVAWEIKEPA